LNIELLCISLYFICLLVSGIIEYEDNWGSVLYLWGFCLWGFCLWGFCLWGFCLCICCPQEIKESFCGINIAVGCFYLSYSTLCERIIRSCDVESCSSCIGKEYLGIIFPSFLPCIASFTIMYLMHGIRKQKNAFVFLSLPIPIIYFFYECFLYFSWLELSWELLELLVRAIQFFLHHSPSQLSWIEIENSCEIHALR